MRKIVIEINYHRNFRQEQGSDHKANFSKKKKITSTNKLTWRWKTQIFGRLESSLNKSNGKDGLRVKVSLHTLSTRAFALRLQHGVMGEGKLKLKDEFFKSM